jgi:hypothetical protein
MTRPIGRPGRPSDGSNRLGRSREASEEHARPSLKGSKVACFLKNFSQARAPGRRGSGGAGAQKGRGFCPFLRLPLPFITSDVVDGRRSYRMLEGARRDFAGVALLWALSGARSSDSFLPSISYCRAPPK